MPTSCFDNTACSLLITTANNVLIWIVVYSQSERRLLKEQKVSKESRNRSHRGCRFLVPSTNYQFDKPHTFNRMKQRDSTSFSKRKTLSNKTTSCGNSSTSMPIFKNVKKLLQDCKKASTSTRQSSQKRKIFSRMRKKQPPQHEANPPRRIVKE